MILLIKGIEMEHKIRYRGKEAKDRNIDELIGISRGIIADGIINTKEGNFLLDWIKKHFDVYDLNTYPVNTIYDRLSRILEDGFIDDEESKECIYRSIRTAMPELYRTLLQ